jgi:hypothetical protein
LSDERILGAQLREYGARGNAPRSFHVAGPSKAAARF